MSDNIRCCDCNEVLVHEPMDDGAPGGDWFYACNICEWHSEQERPHTVIKKSLTLEEIVNLKSVLNSALAYSTTIRDPIMVNALMTINALLLEEEEEE